MPKPALDLPLPSRFPDRSLQLRGPSLLLPYRRVSQCWGVFRLPQVEPCPKTWPISAPVNPRVSVDCGFLSVGRWIGVELLVGQLNMRWIKTFYVKLSTGTTVCSPSLCEPVLHLRFIPPSKQCDRPIDIPLYSRGWRDFSLKRNQGQTVIVANFSIGSMCLRNDDISVQ